MPASAAAFGALLVLALATGTPAAAGATVHVGTSAEFAGAAQLLRGEAGTIVLEPGHYDELAVGPRGPGRLTISARPGAFVDRLRLVRTRAVTIAGLTVTPRGAPGGIEIVESRFVRLEGLHVTGGATGLRANIRLWRSFRVTIARSRLSRCGEPGACVFLGRSSAVTIVGNRFHDCRGCDFVRGFFGRHLVIRENRFDRALVGRCGRDHRVCHHQDLIEIHGGRGLVVERNRFGVYQLPGGGQVALFGAVDDVQIRNNVFLRSDPRVPGVYAHIGINLGGHGALPKRVAIRNNTILSGRQRRDRTFATSVRLKPSYAYLRRAARPVVANNVIRLAATPRVLCHGARVSTNNVILNGRACSSTDTVGDPRLDGAGRPTARSGLTIDAAAPRWATRVDVRGVRRDARPDIGAFEYVPPAGS